MKAKFEAKFHSHATASQVIFAARAGRVTTLQNLKATSDKAASTIKIYRGLTPVQLLAATDGDDVSFTVPAGSGIAANDIVILHDVENNVLIAATVTEVALNQAGTITTVTFGSAPGALAAGTYVYEASLVGSIALGATTKELMLSPGWIAATHESRRPLMVRVDGTAACAIDYAFASFVE